MPGSKVGVLPLGHHVALESLLYGLLLPSGNDAAVALAQHVAGTVHAFVARMNQEAAKLGLGCTRYSSPSGYYNASNFSCAADLAVLAHVDMQQPRIAKVMGTYQADPALPDQGRQALPLQQQPPADLQVSRRHRHEDRLDRSRRALPRRHRRAPRRAPRRDRARLRTNPAPRTRQLLDLGFERVYHQRDRARAAVPARRLIDSTPTLALQQTTAITGAHAPRRATYA